MNWVVFGVLTGLAVFNLLGVGLYHKFYHDYQNELPEKDRKIALKDPDFWIWTVSLLLFGVAYCVLRLILWIKELRIKNAKK